MAPRSILVVPGHVARMHDKALGSAADEVVFDLEDAVLDADKPAAREQVAATLAGPGWRERRVAVRVNPAGTADHAADLALCATVGIASVVVPKVERAGDLDAARAALGPTVGLQALIETPRGLLNAAAIAAADQVSALILGYADLAGALGRRRGEHDWRVQQELLLGAARAAGVAAIDGPFFGLRDARGLAAAARRVSTAGFDGKWAIHPDQIDPINLTFAATADERGWARRVVGALEADGAARVDGAMVDEAMARQARRLLALPEQAPPADEHAAPTLTVAAPYYDELAVGDVFPSPGLTITDGHAALHQAVVGDRLRLALDAALYEAVTGRPGRLAHPILVGDVAIGQSTAPTGRVLGNLFYRGLGARPVAIGTTLRTRTEVVARRDASRGRGVAALRVTTLDATGATVLDFWRCPLLPARDAVPPAPSAPADADLSQVGAAVDARSLVPEGWTLAPLREAPLGPLFADLAAGRRFAVEAAETVTAAPELARLSLNLATTHTDASASVYGRRLVYGGHVIGIAAAHLTRALPDLATILTWESCDHLAPTFEGDLLTTTIEVARLDPLADGGLVGLRAHVTARPDDAPPHEARAVLDWSLTALMP